MSSVSDNNGRDGWSRGCLSVVLSAALVGGVAPSAVMPAAGAERQVASRHDVAAAVHGQPSTDAAAFVQEGTPASAGGQAMAWAGAGIANEDGTRPWELPDGVHHTGLSVGITRGSGTTVLALRDDGRVDSWVESWWERPISVPELPDGVTYTAVSAGDNALGFFLRSDGELVASSYWTDYVPEVPTLPEGAEYTAVDAGDDVYFALTSEGRIVGMTLERQSTFQLRCTEAFTPPEGTKYVAISAETASWMALRDDGAVVSCIEGVSEQAEVHLPPTGSRYTGVDTDRRFGYAATDDGEIVGFGPAGTPAAVPSGRTVVALSAEWHYTGASSGEPNYGHEPGGVALLDDGTSLRWGSVPPLMPLPEGEGRFTAVASHAARSWVIRSGSPIGVEIDITVPETIYFNHRADIQVDVRARDVPATGQVSFGGYLDDGTWWSDEPEWLEDGRAGLSFRSSQSGINRRVIRFDGPPFSGTEVEIDLDVLGQLPSTLTVEIPSTWRQGDHGIYAPAHVEGPGGAFPSDVSINGVAVETGQRVTDGSAVDTTALAPGEHEVRFDYVGLGPLASSTWSSVVTVLPPSPTETTVTGDLDVAYSDYSGLAYATVTTKTLDGMPLSEGSWVVESADGQSLGSSSMTFGRSPSESEDLIVFTSGLAPGDHAVRVRWVPVREVGASSIAPTVPSAWNGTLTVQKAPTRTTVVDVSRWTFDHLIRPTALVTVDGTAGSVLHPSGQLVARIGGTEVGRALLDDHMVELELDNTKVLPGIHTLTFEYVGTEVALPSSASVQVEIAEAALAAPSATITGTPRVGSALVANPGRWPSGTAVSYQWKVDGTPVQGATSSRLVLSAAHLGKRVSVVVTGKKAGYRTVSSESAQTAAVERAQPTVSASSVGTPWRYGITHKLAVTVSAPGVTSSGTVAVYRGSTKVGSATLSGGKATVAIGSRALPVGSQTLSVRYLGSSTVAAKSMSKPVRVYKALATTSASFVDSTVRKPARARLKIAVTTPSSLVPTGYVHVKVDGRTVLKTYLSSSERGRTSVLLPRSLAPGRHKVVAVYQGTSRVSSDASPVRYLTLWRAL